MNKRVAIQVDTQTPDGQGGFTSSWATIATVWASINPVKGYEKFQAGQLQTPVTHDILIRYRSGIITANRLLFNSRIFEIKEIINQNEDNVFLKLKCLEKA